jgi:hypothetical protein
VKSLEMNEIIKATTTILSPIISFFINYTSLWYVTLISN